MYQVVIKDTDGKEHILMDQRVRWYVLINPVLTLTLNRTGSLSFSVPHKHPNLGKINLLQNVIKVYIVKRNKKNGKWTKKWIYSGRATTSEEDFYRTGKIECEGILSYLIDSIVRPYSFAGSPFDYVMQLRQQHNDQVGPSKRFLQGDIDVIDADNNNYIVRESSGYPNTLDEISDKVVDLLSVYISARDEDDGLYLDCVSSLPHNTQKIKFGKNLLDLKRKKDATTIYTAVIPLGAEVDAGEDGESSGKRLTVQYYCPDKQPDDWEVSYADYCTRSGSEADGYSYTFLNGDQAPEWKANTYYYGLDYVYDRDMVDAYDMIYTPVKFNDVTLQSNLFRKGIQALHTFLITDTLSVSAADLSLTADDVESFVLGLITIESTPHNIEGEMLLSKMQIPLLDPLSAEFTIGGIVKTLTEKTIQSKKELSSQLQGTKSTAQSAQNSADQANNAVQNVEVVVSGIQTSYVKNSDFDAYKNEVAAKISTVYRYKGSVANYDALPVSKREVGDTYNVLDTGANYAWTDSGWDKLSETIDLSGYALKEEIPAVPEKISDLENDSGYMTGEDVAAGYVDIDTYNDLVERVKILEGGA